MALLHALLLSGLGLTLVTWLSPANWQRWIMIGGTVLFLAWFAPFSLVLLTCTTLSSFYLFRSALSPSVATLALLTQNVALFAFYKTGIGASYSGIGDRLIPLGLSYYAFRQIHYAFEQYKGTLRPHTLADYVAYLFFLPTILVGPIHRFGPFLRSTFRRRWDPQQLSEGLERILFGYTKVVLLSELLLTTYFLPWTRSLQTVHPRWGDYFELVYHYLNIYLQFAGYSDVAIGLALMLGYRIMENFNYPLLARNINVFWNRWHISLSSWVREYVYTPVSSLTRRPVAGILMTMLVIGLWHEISWRYIFWGAYHGIGVAIWHLYNRGRLAKKLRTSIPGYKALAIVVTFHFVLFSFVIVRENTWSGIFQFYRFLFTGS